MMVFKLIKKIRIQRYKAEREEKLYKEGEKDKKELEKE